MSNIVIVYHRGYGHTKKVAEAVLAGATDAGANVRLIPVGEFDDAAWAELDAADAIVFGVPTYVGGPSADFKKFADASSKLWLAQKWKDKIAAGFTNSAHMKNGDKFLTISYFVTLAMQHGMVWIGTGMMPSNTKAATRNDLNFVGGFTGLLTQSPADASPEEAPPPGELETARVFGARIAAVTARWIRSQAGPDDGGHQPPRNHLKIPLLRQAPARTSEIETTTKVFVDGQEGTTGLKIFEYLSQRRDMEVLRIEDAKRKDIEERRRLINASDVTFLCLPDVASRESVSLVDPGNTRTVMIDASTAFRTQDDWAYGLPELSRAQRDRLRTAKRIAVPGCHASAFVLSMQPLVAGGLVPADLHAHVYSITGYSGGGKKMIAEYEAGGNDKLMSPRPYALGLTHKHLPEMSVRTGLKRAPTFTPIVGPFLKGLAVTTYFSPDQLTRKARPQDVRDMLAEYYNNEPFVRVMPFDAESNLDAGFFDVQACNETNRVDIFVFGNDERFVTVARLDNLGKGASGAAIQCMNLAIGAEEETGLAC